MMAVLGDEDAVLGFRLAGVREGTIFDPATVRDALDKYKDCQLLILTEKTAEYLRKEGLMERVHAVVAEVPDKEGSSGAALRNISRLLQEAIGVKLKG